MADIYGRCAGFLLTGVFVFTAGVLSAFAPSYGWLVVARFVCGGGLGGVPVVFSLAMEFLPSDQRGRWGIGFLIFWAVGGMLEAALAWGIMLTLGWRRQVGLTAIPAGMMLLVWLFLPESPRWLLAQVTTQAILTRQALTNNPQHTSAVFCVPLTHRGGRRTPTRCSCAWRTGTARSCRRGSCARTLPAALSGTSAVDRFPCRGRRAN